MRDMYFSLNMSMWVGYNSYKYDNYKIPRAFPSSDPFVQN